jgi:hypothetical protein
MLRSERKFIKEEDVLLGFPPKVFGLHFRLDLANASAPASGHTPEADEHIHDASETGNNQTDTTDGECSADVGQEVGERGVERGVGDTRGNCHVQGVDQDEADEQECTTDDDGHDATDEDRGERTLVDLEEVLDFFKH